MINLCSLLPPPPLCSLLRKFRLPTIYIEKPKKLGQAGENIIMLNNKYIGKLQYYNSELQYYNIIIFNITLLQYYNITI